MLRIRSLCTAASFGLVFNRKHYLLTIFTIPKAFRGHIGVIQRNAIQSWLKLSPACEVILFGHEEGVAEFAKELGIRNIVDVAYTNYGTPRLNSVFEIAQHIARHSLICYVNSDIILFDDFILAAQRVKNCQFLLVGRRWRIALDESLNFENPAWETKLRADVKERGILGRNNAIDYFIFPRGLVKEMPPFAVGRPGWDNWLIYNMRNIGIPVIDATRVLMAIHQDHDYAHIPGGDGKSYEGPEADENRALLGGASYVFTVDDATKVLTRYGLLPALTLAHLQRKLETLPVLFPNPNLLIRVYIFLLFISVTFATCASRLHPRRRARAILRRLRTFLF